jgi:nucleoid-associated protein YgaU
MGLFDNIMGKGDDKKGDAAKADFSDVGGSSARSADTRSAGARNATPGADFSDVNATSSSAPLERERTYTVVAGDSLSKIAQREYGDAGQWRRIYEANRGAISNPDLIHPGQVLNLPADT